MNRREAAEKKLVTAYNLILETFDDLGYPVKTDANFDETAARAARAMVELVKPTDEIKSQIDEMLSRVFPAQYDEMVISKHNISFGMCPHHLLRSSIASRWPTFRASACSASPSCRASCTCSRTGRCCRRI